MKKLVALFMAVVMMLGFNVTSLAAQGSLTVEQAKQTALDYASVNASEASFTKAYRDWNDGREVYEIEFHANNTEFDMDVDVNTGRITDFSTEYHGGYNQPSGNNQSGTFGRSHDWDDDRYDDWDDRYDFDVDDRFDFDDDWDDMID